MYYPAKKKKKDVIVKTSLHIEQFMNFNHELCLYLTLYFSNPVPLFTILLFRLGQSLIIIFLYCIFFVYLFI